MTHFFSYQPWAGHKGNMFRHFLLPLGLNLLHLFYYEGLVKLHFFKIFVVIWAYFEIKTDFFMGSICRMKYETFIKT